jgi:cytochrome c oxidase assembly factor CtaG
MVFALLGVLYGRGWQRLRSRAPSVATPARLFAFGLGVALIVAAHLPPLYTLSGDLLFVRSILKIATVLLGPPLLWLAAPVHVALWGLSPGQRRRWTRYLFGPSPLHQALRTLTAPGLAWLLFVAVFLIWHDPAFVNGAMPLPWARHLSLWALLITALLYWGHVVGTAPRIHPRLPGWLFFAYLVGADIPNMVSGVTISFARQPVYDYYAAMHATAQNRFNVDVINDQIIAGGLVWFSGSIVYFGSAVLVMRQFFKYDQPLPYPDWDSDERMIAPGLEHRVLKKRRSQE